MHRSKVVLLSLALLFTSVLGNVQLRGSITNDAVTLHPLPPAAKKAAGKPQANIIPNAYIIQLQSEGPVSKRASDLHEEFHSLARRDSSIDYSVRQTFSSDSVFVGLSLTLHAGDVDNLKAMKNVAGVWNVGIVSSPSAAIRGTPLGRRYSTVPVAGTNYSLPYITGDLDVNRPHAMTGVDNAHAAGIKGKGIKIGIVDTGVDHRHPSLGGCFGSGCKIAFGYDFVGDDYDPVAGIPAVESPDPLATCVSGGHGTHVSGIVGMVDQPGTGYGLLGVAPEATIGMYRVFGCGPNTEDDVIVQALLRAASDGVDVISVSLGEPWEDETTNPYSVITSNLVGQGIAVFAANGNSAGAGVLSLSTPAIGADVFAVGSVDNPRYPVTFQLTDSNGRHLRYSSHLPQDSPPEGLIVQVMNYGSDYPFILSGPAPGDAFGEDFYQEALNNLTAAGIDPSNVILAAEWGSYVPESKAQYAATLGYKHFLSYSTTDDDPFFGQEYYVSDPELTWPIEPLVLTVQDSKTLLASYGKHPLQYKIFLNSTDYVAKSTIATTGGFMSNYSSIGPTQQLNIKPELSAPGGNILSLWPLSYEGYTIISGTSMATPYMAASYALIKSQRPGLSVKQIYALMQNSGSILPWYFNQNIKTAAIQQGSGLLNVHNALSWESYITPTQLSAGISTDWVTWNNSVTLNLTITNLSTRSKTYTFSHTPAGLMQDLWWEPDTYNNMYPYYATVTFHANSVVVPGGSSGVVSLDIFAPVPDKATWGDDAIDLLNPMYSGFVVVTNNFETYTIPYVGQIWNATRFGG